MKNSLVKILVFSTLILSTSEAVAQIRVHSGNKVHIGNDYGLPITQSTTLKLNGDSYLSCKPASSGVSFMNYANNFLSTDVGGTGTSSSTYNDPIMLPQWGNSMWIGNYDNRMYRTYTFQSYVVSLHFLSDQRFKTNVKVLDSDYISGLYNLNGYSYDFNERILGNVKDDRMKSRILEQGKDQVGLLAQEVQANFPNLVISNEDEDETLSVNYTALIPVMIEALKDHKREIENLKSIIQELRK